MVLRLPECRAARAPGRGRASSAAAAAAWATRGPRVRMAVHWAEGGAVTAGTHTLTKRRVLGGAAFQATRDLCEAAAGGQVLLSLGAWARLRGAMPAAGFPVVEQLGAFRLAARPHEETWIYEVGGGWGVGVCLLEAIKWLAGSALLLCSRCQERAFIAPPFLFEC